MAVTVFDLLCLFLQCRIDSILCLFFVFLLTKDLQAEIFSPLDILSLLVVLACVHSADEFVPSASNHIIEIDFVILTT